MAAMAVLAQDMAVVAVALADTQEMVVAVPTEHLTVTQAQAEPAAEVAAVPLDTEVAAEAA